MRDVLENLLEQLDDVVVVQGVDDVATTALAGDEVEVTQQAQVVGERVLLEADRGGELACGARRVPQAVEDLNPAR